ncbi:hypothetical protein CAEBREN_22005 [Caenorhabditis brenneri]|uniref:Uncharacterized protein n=1 Tax=Caenorhabditis brenneri TaxID=135651 RepID=G0NNM6_CAEBE|nr:hypothetical protein CAEBREN_22005 [Caenorhabditis brenneri]
MNTPQLYGQRLRPAQETGNEKVLSLLSIHQTLIDHFKDVMIDSSGLVMDHRNSPVGFMEDIFTRLTQRLVFEFLGGHVKMKELLCLGDLADGNDEFHPTTPIPMEAYSESSRSTDNIVSIPKSSMNANLICNKSVMNILNLDHPTPSMPFQHSDFTGNFVMSTIAFGLSTDSLDSNSAPDTLFKTLAFKLQKINVNRTKEIQEVALTNHHHALTSGNLESQFHRQHKNLNDVPVSNPCSTPAWNNETINDGNTFSIPNPGKLMDYLYGDLENPQFLDTESSCMKSEDLCCTIGNNGEGPTFSVPDPSKLMNFLYGDLEFPVFLSFESIEEEVPIYIEYDGNDSKVEVISRSVDHTIEESYQCSGMPSLAVLEKIAGLMTESLRDSNGFTNGMDFMWVKIPSSTRFDKESSKISDSKLSYHQDEFKIADYFNFTSKVHNTPATEPNSPISKNLTTFVPTTSPLFYKSEEDEENMTTDLLPFASSIDKPSLMDKNSTRSSYENPEIYASSPCYNSNFISLC